MSYAAKVRKLLGLVLLTLMTANTAADQTTTSAEAALTKLQAFQKDGNVGFVVQSELDPVIRQGGGGACATAAAIDAVQTLRLMVGMEPLANPHQAALAAIGKQDELL